MLEGKVAIVTGAAVRAEVADAASVQAMANAAAKFGRIDILVNNAALYDALRGGRFEAIGEAEWDDAMRANVKHMAVLQGCGAADAQDGRRQYHQHGLPCRDLRHAICVALHGIEGGGDRIDARLARELGHDNIRVHSIAPSAVFTEGTREFFGEKRERAL